MLKLSAFLLLALTPSCVFVSSQKGQDCCSGDKTAACCAAEADLAQCCADAAAVGKDCAECAK